MLQKVEKNVIDMEIEIEIKEKFVLQVGPETPIGEAIEKAMANMVERIKMGHMENVQCRTTQSYTVVPSPSEKAILPDVVEVPKMQTIAPNPKDLSSDKECVVERIKSLAYFGQSLIERVIEREEPSLLEAVYSAGFDSWGEAVQTASANSDLEEYLFDFSPKKKWSKEEIKQEFKRRECEGLSTKMFDLQRKNRTFYESIMRIYGGIDGLKSDLRKDKLTNI